MKNSHIQLADQLPIARFGLSPKSWIFLLVAAVLNSMAFIFVSYVLAFLSLSLVTYLVLQVGNKKQLVILGFVYGGISALLIDYWIIPVVTNYVKGSIFMGVSCCLASAMTLAFIFTFQFYLYSIIKVPAGKKFSLLNNALLMACLWVAFEWMRAEAFSAMPWLSYGVGVTPGRNLYLIQPAVFGGVYILSFLVVFSAYFFAWSFYKKKWKLLFIPFAVIAFQFIAGIFLYNNTTSRIKESSEKKISIALILAALKPETVWDEKNADALVAHLLSLNDKAIAEKPDLIVWTETIVPWTYAPDDDFIKEITAKTSPSGIHSFIGMNSSLNESGEVLCNSVYFFNPSGKEYKRYDKQDLLTLVEKPLLDGRIILPFLSSYGLKMREGSYKDPIETPWGKAGILLCNESTNSSLPKDLVKEKGASFLVNMGNDAWFSGHYIPRQHFYNCRLRAVENRKDIVVNNNMGVCGVIQANGDITAELDGKESSVQLVEIQPNHFSSQDHMIFLYIVFFIILIAITNNLYFINSNKQLTKHT